MKNLHYILLCLLCFFIYSCNSNIPKEQLSDAINSNATRNVKKNSNFKSHAVFKNGICSSGENELASLSNANLKFIVIYDSKAQWANVFNSGRYEKTGDEDFNNILKTYQLVISEQSEMDADREMLILEHDKKIEKPEHAAAEISKIKDVLSVHIEKIKADSKENDDLN